MDVQTILSESEAQRRTRGAEAAGQHRSQFQRETSQNRGQLWRRQSRSKRWSQPEEATETEERREGAARRPQPTSPHTSFWAHGSDPLSLLTVFFKRACGIKSYTLFL